MNNASLLTADRKTHLKIVVVSLVCATLIAGMGIAGRMNESSAETRTDAVVVKAGKPVTAATAADRTIR
jgi:hypothetical protein